MIPRFLWATLAVFIAWSLLDFLLHGVLLGATYAATAELWRPPSEMKMLPMQVVVFLHAALFAGIYTLLVGTRSVRNGLLYGLLFGIATGLGMGFGTWCVMPIPATLAWAWFLGSTVEATVAGGLVGAIVRPKA